MIYTHKHFQEFSVSFVSLGETQGRHTHAVSSFLQRMAGLESRWREQ